MSSSLVCFLEAKSGTERRSAIESVGCPPEDQAAFPAAHSRLGLVPGALMFFSGSSGARSVRGGQNTFRPSIHIHKIILKETKSIHLIDAYLVVGLVCTQDTSALFQRNKAAWVHVKSVWE